MFLLVLVFFASRDFKQIWYCEDFSLNPISVIRLIMFGLLYGVTSVDVSFVDCFLGCLICASSKVFIGIGLLTTPAKVDCPFRTDFQVGAMVFYISDVFFLLDCFGNGAVFSKVEDHFLLDDADFLIDVYCLDVWAVFFFRYLLFPVSFAFLFFGHSCYCNLSCFSSIVNFFGSPDVVSSLNIGCCGAFGPQGLKSANKVLFSERVRMHDIHLSVKICRAHISLVSERKQIRYFSTISVISSVI